MVLAERSDFYCSTDFGVVNEQNTAAFRNVTTLRRLVQVGGVVPLYPYLHRRHAELAPRLAAALKQMKSEGLIERYRAEVLREVSGR